MLKFTGAFLLAAVVFTNTAEAKVYNQWLLQPQKKHTETVGNQTEIKSSEQLRQMAHIRLINAKDRYNKLILSCKVNTGRLHLSAVIGAEPGRAADNDDMAKIERKQGDRKIKRQKTLLNLLIDGKPVLKDNPAFQRPERRRGMAVVAMIQGDAMTNFVSQFLAAKKNMTVSFGDHFAESFSVANSAQTGLALQNCLHK